MELSELLLMLSRLRCAGTELNVLGELFVSQGLNGEILVTARTDPGWVPLYPLCSGLIIERGRQVYM